jgi:uncharacterized Tic20 family protein
MEKQPVFSAETPEVPAGGNQPRAGSNDRNMAVLAHLGGIFFGFIPALIIWLVRKDESPYVDQQAKEALNFQIFVAICYLISVVLFIVVIGVVLLFLTWLADLLFCILAAIKTSSGEPYRYPLSIRLIK